MNISDYQANIEKLKQIVNCPANILILTHQNPDGDAMGACLGLYNFLIQLNHNVTVFTPNQYPDFLAWLPGNEAVQVFDKENVTHQNIFFGAQVIFCLDFNRKDRIGDMGKLIDKSQATKILIDHHPEPEDFTHLVFSDINASAASEVLYQILSDINNSLINKDVAESLFTGIMADTGCFNFNSSSPVTYNIIAHLLTLGIHKDKIFDRLYDNFSIDRMRLMGYALHKKMQVIEGYNTGYIVLTKKELEDFNFQKGDTEGFVNLPLSIKGVIFSVLFVEMEDQIRISLRSKGKFDVSLLARDCFNGGGHKNASGGRTYGTIDEAVNLFLQKIKNYHQLLQYSF